MSSKTILFLIPGQVYKVSWVDPLAAILFMCIWFLHILYVYQLSSYLFTNYLLTIVCTYLLHIYTNHLLFLHSDDIIRSLEQNDWLLNKSAILFWRFHQILQNHEKFWHFDQSHDFLTFWWSLEQNGWLLNQSAILFWRFHQILRNHQMLEKQMIDLCNYK